jgi:predicted nuclease of restriction endonuclease-like (RecB) superfamily
VAALFGEEYAVRVGGGEAVGFGFKKGAQMTQAPTPAGTPLQADFSEITRLIVVARARAVQAVNTTLIDLYWQVGQTISQKIAQAQWGDGVVAQLAAHLAQTQPGLTGFTSRNLFRMRQFYEAYRDDEKVSPLVRQLPWTHNLIILNQSKRPEEREFYLRLAVHEKWSSRELERQFKTALFERTVLNPAKVSAVLSQMQPDALSVFKDSYLVEFLGLPQGHSPPKEDADAVARINASGAGLVFVGLGCPKQELWMQAHRGRINAVMLGVGAAFDVHAGTVSRAPAWMRHNGLEWLHRLASEVRQRFPEIRFFPAP